MVVGTWALLGSTNAAGDGGSAMRFVDVCAGAAPIRQAGELVAELRAPAGAREL